MENATARASIWCMPVIEIEGLTKQFGHVRAVDALGFSVTQGSIVGFLGANGAGKTTTLRMLLGLVEPTCGSATINGVRYRDMPNPLREVGAVLDAGGFHPGRTARNHLRVVALAGAADRRRIDQVLELVGLSAAAERRVGGFSLGMRQRLGIASALLNEPPVLILDEPANGLDPEGVRWLRDLLRGLAAEGQTVLVSSHILAEVAQTVDSVVIVDGGRLVAHSRLDELVAGSASMVRVRTPRAAQLVEALAARGVKADLVDDDRLEVHNSSGEQIGLLAAEHAIPIFETNTEAVNLEDVYLSLTGAGERSAA
jgi:ABC-2 type transport system ATP-binding protein